ncbi:MAG TPA: SpoIIE family protein phosphatase [Usitatibacter sp.]|nr:SpoIIE family protein phosphatase [Usitatibacter sp.]
MLLAAISLFLLFSPTAQLLRNAVFDAYQRAFPLERASAPVAIVVIDENALARFGQWPWPRTRIAEVLDRIAQAQPAAIALDLAFPDEDRFSPQSIAAELPLLPQSLAEALALLPSNDQRLAQAMRGRPVVLGISAEAQPDPRFAKPPRAEPVRVSADGLPALRSWDGHIGNVETLDAVAAGRGLLNSGAQDQVVRVVPLVARVQGAIVPSLGVEALRVASGAGPALAAAGHGFMSLRLAELDTTLQDDGTTWLRFGHHDAGRFVSAVDLLEGRADRERLQGKVVLVAVNGLGLLDYKTTPLGELVTGAEIHAQEVENLFNGVTLLRPAGAAAMEVAVLVVLGLAIIIVVPRLTALQGINVVTLLVLLLAGGGMLAFARYGLLFDPAWPAIGVLAVFGSVVVGTLSEAERQRRQLREQAARMAGEVDAARRIQMGLLPVPDETLGGDSRLRIAAHLEPARTVGGDFYDCFMLDARRLCVVVADVSGKGLPAALFMAAVKSHVKSAALRGGSVGRMLTLAQEEIARENPEQLFVTAFIAVLDLDNGVLEYGNAGHEPPFVRTRHGAPGRLEATGGPPLCVVEGYAYGEETRLLQPGDWIFVVTDGATEAMNRAREFFGVERLRAAIAAAGEDASPGQLIGHVRDEVARFAEGADAADDITLVALRWDGPRGRTPAQATGRLP